MVAPGCSVHLVSDCSSALHDAQHSYVLCLRTSASVGEGYGSSFAAVQFRLSLTLTRTEKARPPPTQCYVASALAIPLLTALQGEELGNTPRPSL